MITSAKSAASPRTWALWSFGLPGVLAILAIDVAGAAATVAGLLFSPGPSRRDWALFALFTGCALVHVALTRLAEERRRGRRLQRGAVEFVDQSSIWFCGAALVLPVTLVVPLVVVVRAVRYRIARRPPALWIASSATVLLSVHGVGLVRHLFGVDDATGIRTALVLVLAIAVYFMAQAVPIAVYRGVRFRDWRLVTLLGTPGDNWLIVHTLLLAAAAAVIAVVAPACLVGVLAVAVRETLNVGKIAALEAEREQLTVDALTDSLTTLPNRRGFELVAGTALEVDRSGGHPTSVLMLDIDHFKDWNTRLGHFGGDQVLRAVAERLRACVRRGDIVSRWGGEELAVVLPGTTAREAVDIAERIRVAVRELDTEISTPAGGRSVRLGRGGLPPCTISIGVAVAPDHGVTLADLQDVADQALRAAKWAGRDRVELAGRPRLPTQNRLARTEPA
ncbi:MULTISPECIES: GGDEF domain-containing protein [Actinokineospora]|uniref:GGDEF domain-containing protein n=1 Tax=Actinokineospora fastidiosa TaxID=1816 RepID=A0A918LD99_9PSEU|nr:MULTISPECIES: diguanylate cyclase [Actinokineospora]UVS79892.1 putative diguanylate cyclase YdaM [Actinokineospora sp. UTMC 2448]GGS31577.1 GGDEF domain-containing protein [Actinokineospora fastidiosa]